jgi:hypothetical protein
MKNKPLTVYFAESNLADKNHTLNIKSQMEALGYNILTWSRDVDHIAKSKEIDMVFVFLSTNHKTDGIGSGVAFSSSVSL